MDSKEPVLLTILVETASLRWFVGGIGLDGKELPLLRSANGDLSPYQGVDEAEQLSFLRHRLCGVLQRGCDRLWARQLKPCHIVFVTDGPFPRASPDLAARLAQHLKEWLWNPPVVFYTQSEATPALTRLAGEIPSEFQSALDDGLPKLWQAMHQADRWEQAPAKPKS